MLAYIPLTSIAVTLIFFFSIYIFLAKWFIHRLEEKRDVREHRGASKLEKFLLHVLSIILTFHILAAIINGSLYLIILFLTL